MKEKNLKAAFGIRIRMLRRTRNYTQEELAEKLSCSTEYVSHIERGVAAPSFEMLARLASALHVQISDLFLFDDFVTAKKKT